MVGWVFFRTGFPRLLQAFAVMTGAFLASLSSPLIAAEQERLTPDDIAVAEPLQVPLSAAKPPADQPAAATDTKPKSGWLGLTVDDSLVTGRLVIVAVASPSPAQKVGIQTQDVLLAIDGEPLQTADQLAAVLAAIPPAKQVRALLGRTDGVKEVTITASERPAATKTPSPVAVTPEPAQPTAATAEPAASRFSRQPAAAVPPTKPPAAGAPAGRPEAPALPPAARPQPPAGSQAGSRFGDVTRQPPAALPAPEATPIRPPPITPSRVPTAAAARLQGRTALGVRTVSIDSATQARYRLPAAAGAYVLGVVESLPASQAGLRPGSVIVAFDNRPVRSPEELNQLVTGSSPGRLVSLEYVLPGGDTRRAEIELQSLDPALERALIGVPEAGNSQLPAIVRRPIVPGFEAAAPSFAAGNLTSAASSDSLLQEEVRLLREEVLRLRSRLDRLEAGGSGGIRGRGNTLR